MYDLKLLGRNESDLENEIKIVQTISKDINMNFGLEKYAMMIMIMMMMMTMMMTTTTMMIIIIIIIIDMNVSCHRSFFPGTSLEPAVIPTAQASSFTLQYFPYHV